MRPRGLNLTHGRIFDGPPRWRTSYGWHLRCLPLDRERAEIIGAHIGPLTAEISERLIELLRQRGGGRLGAHVETTTEETAP
jgi:hypothetical protein